MGPPRRRCVAAVPVVLAVLLVSCGGKPRGGAGGGAAKADFLAGGNAICARLTQQLNQLPQPGTDPQATLSNINVLVAAYQATLAQLRALPEPKGDAATLKALFAKVDVFIGLARQEGAVLAAGGATVPQSLVDQTSAASAAANTAFNDYGLAACAP